MLGSHVQRLITSRTAWKDTGTHIDTPASVAVERGVEAKKPACEGWLCHAGNLLSRPGNKKSQLCAGFVCR
jgi:hypothetical protein